VGCKGIVISRHPRNGDPNHCNSPVRFAPFSPHVRVLQPARGLDDCTDACHGGAAHCITQISVEAVVAAATEILCVRPAIRTLPQTQLNPAVSQHLLRSHSPDAVLRSVLMLRPGGEGPSL
jgi:hypothetical protein